VFSQQRPSLAMQGTVRIHSLARAAWGFHAAVLCHHR
jgi:hypothetical protein